MSRQPLHNFHIHFSRRTIFKRAMWNESKILYGESCHFKLILWNENCTCNSNHCTGINLVHHIVHRGLAIESFIFRKIFVAKPVRISTNTFNIKQYNLLLFCKDVCFILKWSRRKRWKSSVRFIYRNPIRGWSRAQRNCSEGTNCNVVDNVERYIPTFRTSMGNSLRCLQSKLSICFSRSFRRFWVDDGCDRSES